MNRTGQPPLGRGVDWDFAGTVGAQLVKPAPPVTDYTRRQVVDDLLGAAAAAESPVGDVTLLVAPGAAPLARVVDRRQWIRAASESMRVMTGGARRPAATLTGRLAGAQTGAVLAFISSGILGQYDPFAGSQGDLLLVYPNVIEVERRLQVDPRDFRMWVCLHEVTHRVQFGANPWLVGHMSDALATLTTGGDDDVGQVLGRVADLVTQHRRGVEEVGRPAGLIGVLRALQSEPQRRALDQLLVLGTLLEGHADYVMDVAGRTLMPSLEVIRRRFDERRNRRQPPLQRLLRGLLGVDAKLSQYTRGRAFVDHVVERVGMARFNAVWTGPQALPLPAEIEEPQRWIDRVL